MQTAFRVPLTVVAVETGFVDLRNFDQVVVTNFWNNWSPISAVGSKCFHTNYIKVPTTGKLASVFKEQVARAEARRAEPFTLFFFISVAIVWSTLDVCFVSKFGFVGQARSHSWKGLSLWRIFFLMDGLRIVKCVLFNTEKQSNQRQRANSQLHCTITITDGIHLRAWIPGNKSSGNWRLRNSKWVIMRH